MMDDIDVRYDNETIGKLLSIEQAKNDKVKFEEIQFESDSFEDDLKKCFELAALKSLCLIGQMASESQAGAGAEHWVIYYFLDGNNLFYFDPLGETNTLLAEKMLLNFADKNLFTTKVKQARDDSTSCGPICVEALKYFVGQSNLKAKLQGLKQGDTTHLNVYEFLPTNLQLASKGNKEDIKLDEIRERQLKGIKQGTVPDLTV